MSLATAEAFEDVIHAHRIFAHRISLNAFRKTRLQTLEKGDTEPKEEARNAYAIRQPLEIGLLAPNDCQVESFKNRCDWIEHQHPPPFAGNACVIEDRSKEDRKGQHDFDDVLDVAEKEVRCG